LTLRGALNGEKIIDDAMHEYQAGPAAVFPRAIVILNLTLA